MHQFQRSPPPTASPAQSPKTNPMRSNNQREPSETTRAMSSGRVTPGAADDVSNVSDEDPKVHQFNTTVQHMFKKAMNMIVSERLELPAAISTKTGQPRANKWFGLDTPESDAINADSRPWRNLDIGSEHPPTLIVDILLRSSDLKSNETLVIYDEFGKVRDVEEAVRNHRELYYDKSGPNFDIVLERWQFSIDDFDPEFRRDDLQVILPKVYKNAVVLYRTLFSMLHLLPAWKLSTKSGSSNRFLPQLGYRIYQRGQFPFGQEKDGLYTAIPDADSQELEDFTFDSLETPCGKFRAKVTYRKHADFRIEVSEAPLSSRFEESNMFKPSLGPQSSDFKRSRDVMPPPPAKSTRQILHEVDQAQTAYGSLSTYHGLANPLASSPISTLRAAAELNNRESPPPIKALPERRISQERPTSPRSAGMPPNPRRSSLSFNPFKSPSIAASPSPLAGEYLASQRMPITGANRNSALTALTEARNPGMAQQSGQAAAAQPQVIASSAPTSRPRYSSSFSHRRSRNSVNLSRDEDGSSSRGSPRPPSGTGEGNSSGSLHADEDDISDFLRMLDAKKDLKSFKSPGESGVAESTATRRTTAQLSKFARIRDSTALLSDSMSSSVLGHRSSTSSSRQLSSVPPIAGASLSTASSPGERMSPRTPHTPAIPSRLSANSIVDYNNTQRLRSDSTAVPEDNEEEEEESTAEASRGGIDIPSSPRVFGPAYRRSSSVAQQHRAMVFDDDEALQVSNRSTSLGGNGERQPMSLSQMLNVHDEATTTERPVAQPTGGEPMSRQRSTSSQDEPPYSLGNPSRGSYRLRGLGRGLLPHHGSSTSLAGDRGGASSGSDSRGGRHSYRRSRDLDEEELLFAMSELGTAQQGRRSLEEGRRGGEAARGSRRRGQQEEEAGDPQTWT